MICAAEEASCQLLQSAVSGQPLINLSVQITSDSTMIKFVEEVLMWDSIKCVWEVEYQDILLVFSF